MDNSKMIFCPKCGSKEQGNAFCSKCGNKLANEKVSKDEAIEKTLESNENRKEKKKKNKKSRKLLYIILVFIIGTFVILENQYNEPKCYSVDYENFDSSIHRLAGWDVREAVVKKYKNINVDYMMLDVNRAYGEKPYMDAPRTSSIFRKFDKLDGNIVGLYQVRVNDNYPNPYAAEIYEVFVTYKARNMTTLIFFNDCYIRLDEIVLIRKK